MECIAAAGAQTPLIDGDRRRSVVALRRAQTDEVLVQYQATVLRAVEDVESVLSAGSRDRERLTRLTLVRHGRTAQPNTCEARGAPVSCRYSMCLRLSEHNLPRMMLWSKCGPPCY